MNSFVSENYITIIEDHGRDIQGPEGRGADGGNFGFSVTRMPGTLSSCLKDMAY